MKLKTFSSENIGDDLRPTLSINSNRTFRLNKAAVELFKLNEGNKVLFHQDEQEPEDWYISVNKERGFKFNEDNSRPNYFIKITPLYNIFKDCFDLTESFKFYISNEVVTKDKVDYYPIITKNNLSLKNKK